MTAIRKQKTTAARAPRKAKKADVVSFAWAAFWEQQPDLPVISAWAPTQPEHTTERHASRSVVSEAKKKEYAANGTKGRGCGDDLWEFCLRFLGDDGKLLVAAWEAFLTENGIRHEHWRREGNGWQGRLRMSGSVSLRAKAKRGEAIVFGGAVVA